MRQQGSLPMNSRRWGEGTRGRASQVMKLAGEVRGRAERTIFWRVWERMLENEFIDRGIALAAKAFVSFFPAVIVVAAFAPPGPAACPAPHRRADRARHDGVRRDLVAVDADHREPEPAPVRLLRRRAGHGDLGVGGGG